MKFSLCWDCANSTKSGCSWAENFTPVKGWEAEETKTGYLILKCPEFNRNSYEYGTIRNLEDYLEFEKKRRMRNEQVDNHWKSD